MNEAFAPAKINLTLHVTGKREDGFHLLDSLVVFVDVGDQLQFRQSTELKLNILGPKAQGIPIGDSNLVLRAARLVDPSKGAEITLTKNLPAAAGIGGGSSDAAATVKALCQLWDATLPVNPEILGADVPVCMRARTTRMQGIGELLSEVPDLPNAWLVLVNPGVSVSTPEVFRKLVQKENPWMGTEIPSFKTANDLADWLHETRNDLQSAAIALEPIIGDVLDAVGDESGCLIARMSGSGATCWGLFGDKTQAQQAAERITASHPEWWTVSTKIKSVS
ncbi:MAG: 4-(cytidine 5'-diphospho)-2-C-methyl-D-erythritol kinase [Paracoccaceae bacterium]|nr:4-(cytidine 5'-diphospho)-2-C-methyl-D-erythritol kinase [Paracoccaceae bacterium]MDG1737118.1 4-(cytidine 5'-diphospho)-2-C-methyl-D-erythritol kinase [Paracoccaceae bacterium]MDG2260180.1 4-(cytidine 5'-diphospho)-2-C-methyl-D-erythritol kinase [Paracoccaceae bacterium]